MGFPVDYVVFILMIIFLIPSMSRLTYVIKMPQSKFFLMFVLAVFLSNAVHGNMDSAVEHGVRYLKFSVIYFAIALSVNSFNKIKWLALHIVILITFIAYQGILQAKTGTNCAAQSLYWLDRIRWVGLFNVANTTATAFIIAIPFLLEYFCLSFGYRIFSIAS